MESMRKEAIVDKMQALKKIKLGIWYFFQWEKKPVGCVFTVKQKVDGSIERYKARLVA